MPKDTTDKPTIKLRRAYEKGGSTPESQSPAIFTTAKNAFQAAPSNSIDNQDKPLLVCKDYCCFCGDFLLPLKKNVCNDCGAYMCEQVQEHGNGCIAFKTAPPASEFLCLPCDAKASRNRAASQRNALPYRFIGYGGRKKAKLTWPLVLVNMRLYTAFDTLVADSLKLDFKFHYIAMPSNLELVDISLKGNGQTVSLKAIGSGTKFVARSITAHVPANCFIVVDTHADTMTGELQWAGGVTGVQTATASEIITEFCGRNFLQALKHASDAAQGFKRAGNPGWYDDSPFFRGGWRGLFIASCSPAVREDHGFRDLKKLVEQQVSPLSDYFDFVFAFAGSSTISNYVKDAISHAIEAVAIDKTDNIWGTLSRVVGRDINLLHTNAVVIIFRERGEGAKCRHIALHSPPHRIWGIEFTTCGTHDCRPSAYDFLIRNNASGVSMECRICGWKSRSLKPDDVDGLVFRLNSTAPGVFWHEYPPSVQLQNIFVHKTHKATFTKS